MPIASNTSDQKKLSADTGIKMPRVMPGQNKMPPLDLETQKDEERPKPKAIDDEARKAKLIGEAKKRFVIARTIESTNRKDALDDLKFLKGEQWSQADAGSRAADGRPCITENRLPTFVNQITNDQRQNRPSIVVSPMGDKASKNDAKMLRGMIRAIERDSFADVAYDTGFASAVSGGWGYWRVVTEYEAENSFNKVVCIKQVPNPMNVYLDPGHTPFMLDSKWAFISEMIDRQEFEREYPDAQMTPWGETGVGDTEKDWLTQDEIRVAEYYYFKHEERELVMLDNGHSGWEDKLDDKIKERIKSGSINVVNRRTVHTEKLKWCKMTAIEVLEERDCDGHYIPIIECLGSTLNINGKTTKKGIVRDAKGPQMMGNYYTTLEAENVALQPKAPWIMEEGQVEGHEDKWQQANRKSYSYLLYKGVNLGGKPAPPPQRQPFTGPPAAILAAKQGAVEALKAVTGIRFDATMSERMQDESGRAIRELNRNANLGAFHYIDNFGRSLRNTGVVLIDLISEVYDTQRIVSILDDSGMEDQVMINPNQMEAYKEVQGTKPGQTQPSKIKLFNPKIGRYQVTVTIGPSYATKRVEAAESQIEFMRAVPQIAPIIADLIAKNSDWEGADEIASRIAKSLPPNMLSPNRDDMSPQVQALISQMQQQIQQMTNQQQQLVKELSDRKADRDVAYTQIEKTFEAKVLAIAQKMEEVQSKQEMHNASTIGVQLADIAKSVAAFNDILSRQQTAPGVNPGQPPAGAQTAIVETVPGGNPG